MLNIKFTGILGSYSYEIVYALMKYIDIFTPPPFVLYFVKYFYILNLNSNGYLHAKFIGMNTFESYLKSKWVYFILQQKC